MTGRIHSFQSLGTVDGPGVRCVVFMQGCPLRCACCHNPDTWDFNGGEEVDCDTLVTKIMRCKNYFGDKGGVTVSGGEPLLQARFVAELFKKLKSLGIGTALDTSGCMWDDDIAELLRYTDYVLLDYKYAEPDSYNKYTKCEQGKVDRFLNELESRGISTWIRRVIIPGLNDDDASMLQLKSLKEEFSCIKKTELLPFRKLCREKYKSMDIEFPLENVPEPTKDKMEYLNKIIK